jgi:hypothetical protein
LSQHRLAHNNNDREQSVHKRILLAFIGLWAPLGAQAHGNGRDVRYRVEEVEPPAVLLAACQPQLGILASAVEVNDTGIVVVNFACYTHPVATVEDVNTAGDAFTWSPWFGAQPLQTANPSACCAFATTLNNRGEIFGGDFTQGDLGVKWTLAGGYERVFDDPECGPGLNINAAAAGNAQYVVGWGFRTDPAMGPPYDTLCLESRWVIRTRSGEEIMGPANGQPLDINVWSTAVGTANFSAIRYQVQTGQIRTLHTGDASHPPVAFDINDLGEVAGYVFSYPAGDLSACPQAVAVRWDRDDRETILPRLPGATSARAYAVGSDGETVGDSGPGKYCPPERVTREHAVLWRNGHAVDLNDLVPRNSPVTLASAASINRRGQILAFGTLDGEAPRICPQAIFDPDTGTSRLDLSQRCAHERIYLLTPL